MLLLRQSIVNECENISHWTSLALHWYGVVIVIIQSDQFNLNDPQASPFLMFRLKCLPSCFSFGSAADIGFLEYIVSV